MGRPAWAGRLAGWVLVLLAPVLTAFLPSGYLLVEPGPAPAAATLVHVEEAAPSGGAASPSAARGDGTDCGGPNIHLLTVRVRPLRLAQLPAAWMRRGEARLLPAERLLGGRSLETYADEARRQMDEAERSAVEVATAAYAGAGRPVPDGGVAGRWRWRAPGGRLLEIRLSDGGIAGPSAGLALALEVDRQIACRLARMPARSRAAGRVAVSGSLDESGRVGRVGQVALKALSARRLGASLLLLPAGETGQAEGAFGGAGRLAAVRDFGEAARLLGLPAAP
ncbi:MAG: hypothetical protein IRZ26_01860 [Clostridia bacterium]|nr:hypothetical protein [Clostridia bacterium]MCL6521326.1 hypothetical protein [Bacillota bacterium]